MCTENSVLSRELERLWSDSSLHDAAARALTFPGQITAAQVRNMLALAQYLSELPEEYDQFDMAYYRTDDSATEEGSDTDRADLQRGYLSCGTSACAAGHGPVATKVLRRRGEDWEEYISRVLGRTTTNYRRFLYSAWWEDMDNSPRGAAARIVHLIRLASLPLPELPTAFVLPWDNPEEFGDCREQYAYLMD